MNRWIQRALTLALLGALGLGLTACNTLEGVGQDIQKAGRVIEGAAKK